MAEWQVAEGRLAVAAGARRLAVGWSTRGKQGALAVRVEEATRRARGYDGGTQLRCQAGTMIPGCAWGEPNTRLLAQTHCPSPKRSGGHVAHNLCCFCGLATKHDWTAGLLVALGARARRRLTEDDGEQQRQHLGPLRVGDYTHDH